jgi:hypothetical protein
MNSKIDAKKREITELFYEHNGKNTQLSSWGEYFIKLGESTRQLVADKSRIVIALAVPTRVFSSTLISFGYIVRRLQFSKDDNYYKHAEYLKSLPPGTPVLLRSVDGKKYKGELGEHRNFNDTLYFEIKYEQSSTRYVRIEESKRIEILDTEVVLPRTQKGREIALESDFCTAIIGPKCASSLISESNLEAVIIGPKKAIEDEATAQEFSVRGEQTGTLQEILRVKEFQNNTKSYRSRTISDRIRATGVHSGISDPPLVIFDGAQGFLKWRSYWKKSSWIVILDRTEYQFDAAINQINREYIMHRKGDNGLEMSDLHIPLGIEMTAFEVRD